MTGDKDEAHERLLELLEERERAAEGARRVQLNTQIAAAAEVLGLSDDEVASITPQLVAADRRPHDFAGRFRLHRRGRDFLPFVWALLLVPAVAGLGAPEIAAAVLLLVASVWVLHSRKRLAVFDVDASGRMDFHRHGTVDWPLVDEVTFRYRYPWLASSRSLARPAGETAAIRIRLRNGRELSFAQGQLFQIRPIRRHAGLHRLRQFLRSQAVAAGLKVEKLPTGDGWRAMRPQP